MTDRLKYDDITGRIIGCAMRVHSALGNGFMESVYQNSLEIEMKFNGLALRGKSLWQYFIAI